MTTVKILIVEDNVLTAEDLSQQLKNAGYQTVLSESGEQALNLMALESPDLVLMDIHLKGQLDGIETVERIKELYIIPVIFLTDYDDKDTFHRARATRPAAYVLKPFNQRELTIAIEVALYNAASQAKEPVQELQSATPNHYVLHDRLFVRKGQVFHREDLADILYLQADRAYCQIFTRKEHYMVSINLNRLSQQLKLPYFMRIHRSYMVNLKAIDQLETGYVTIANKRIPVGAKYRKEFNERFRFV